MLMCIHYWHGERIEYNVCNDTLALSTLTWLYASHFWDHTCQPTPLAPCVIPRGRANPVFEPRIPCVSVCNRTNQQRARQLQFCGAYSHNKANGNHWSTEFTWTSNKTPCFNNITTLEFSVNVGQRQKNRLLHQLDSRWCHRVAYLISSHHNREIELVPSPRYYVLSDARRE